MDCCSGPFMGGEATPGTRNHGLRRHKEQAAAKVQGGDEARQGFSRVQLREKILEVQNRFARVNLHLIQ